MISIVSNILETCAELNGRVLINVTAFGYVALKRHGNKKHRPFPLLPPAIANLYFLCSLPPPLQHNVQLLLETWSFHLHRGPLRNLFYTLKEISPLCFLQQTSSELFGNRFKSSEFDFITSLGAYINDSSNSSWNFQLFSNFIPYRCTFFFFFFLSTVNIRL